MCIAILFMVMVSVLQNTHLQHCSMHFSVHCGFMPNMIAGQIWSHERWHTIHIGQPALLLIAICIREYCNSHLLHRGDRSSIPTANTVSDATRAGLISPL